MRLKSFALIGALALSFSSTLFAAESIDLADGLKLVITIVNNTDHYGSGNVKSSPCSNIAGQDGIIKPHETKSLDLSIASMFCGSGNCEAHVFLNKNCSGKALANVIINMKKGIVDIKNNDPEHYNVSFNGNTAVLDPL